MLIRDAEIEGRRIADLRIEDGRIAAVGRGLERRADDTVLDAGGAALLPGLHDHHLHLVALAAAQASVPCGPPQVRTADDLARSLRAAGDAAPATGWIRGVGYDESVAGDLDRDALDRWVTQRPLRIQHRSGRLWILNSAALERVRAADEADPLERSSGRPTGRLYDADAWLRQRIGGERPALHAVGRLLACYGVTGVTDTTPHNGLAEFAAFARARAGGELCQDLIVMGDAGLDAAAECHGLRRGAHKFHLHDAELPDFDATCAAIRRAHAAGSGAAFHCVTRADLAFALSALREAGTDAADRIEHAAIAPPELLAQIRELGLAVVTQPNFIAERGDEYRVRVDADERPWLYRLRGFLDAGVRLAGGTDAPFGDPNPWAAMQAAVTRRSGGGAAMGADEGLSPEQALALFTCAGERPGGPARRIAVGAAADLCLLDRPWARARQDLAAVAVRATLKGGRRIA